MSEPLPLALQEHLRARCSGLLILREYLLFTYTNEENHEARSQEEGEAALCVIQAR